MNIGKLFVNNQELWKVLKASLYFLNQQFSKPSQNTSQDGKVLPI